MATTRIAAAVQISQNQQFLSKNYPARPEAQTLMGGSFSQVLSEQQVELTAGPHTNAEIDSVQRSSLLRSDWLIASPYTEQRHLLNLKSLDAGDRLMAMALTSLTEAKNDYATSRYEDAFEWVALMRSLKALADFEGTCWRRQEFYVVEFRSKLKENIDGDLLFQLDKESHGEAAQSGGLLKYWYGRPDAQRRNLATCLWRSKDDAVKGGRGPWHKQARAVIPQMYEDIWVKGLRLVIEDDVQDWTFSPYA